MFVAPTAVFVATRPKTPKPAVYSVRIPSFSETVKNPIEIAEDVSASHDLETHFVDVVLLALQNASHRGVETCERQTNKKKKKKKKKGGGKRGKNKHKKAIDPTEGWEIQDRVVHKLSQAFEDEDDMIQQKLSGTFVEHSTKKMALKKKRKKKGTHTVKLNKDCSLDEVPTPDTRAVQEEFAVSISPQTPALLPSRTNLRSSFNTPLRWRLISPNECPGQRSNERKEADDKTVNLSATEVSLWRGWTSINMTEAESNLAIIRPPPEEIHDSDMKKKNESLNTDETQDCSSSLALYTNSSTKALRSSKLLRESSYETIRVVSYSISVDDAQIIGEAMQRHPKLRVLQLEHNSLSTRASEIILRAMPDTIEHISFAGNESLTVAPLSIFLERCAVQLVFLDLSSCGVRDAGMRALCSSFLSQKLLRTLNLSRNGITYISAELLARLVRFDRIRDLRLAWNELGQRGIINLCDAMKTSQHLHSLDLSWNGIGSNALDARRGNSEGIVALSEMLRVNKTLWHLNLSANTFTYTDVREIAVALESNQTLLGLHFDQNRGYVNGKGFLVPQTHAVVNVHVPCRVCYPWIEHIFKVTDLPPEVGAEATVCVCLSVDDWALDRMSKYNMMADEVKSKNCETGNKYIYKLSRMIPADRPVTFCFAAFIGERERGMPIYFTTKDLPTRRASDTRERSSKIPLWKPPPLSLLNVVIKGAGAHASITSRHEGLRAIADHSRRLNMPMLELSRTMNTKQSAQQEADEAHKPTFMSIGPRMNPLIPAMHTRAVEVIKAMPNNNDEEKRESTQSLHQTGDSWIMSPSTCMFCCRSYGGQRPPMFYDSTDILDAAFEADWERFINGGFLNGVGIKGMPLGDIFKEHSMLSEVRSAFRAGFPLLLKVFKYYSSREEPHQIQSTEIVAVNLDNFTQFCEDTKITDEKFPNDFVRKAWQGAMLDPDAQHLERFELCLQSLLLVAKAKFLDAMQTSNIGEAVKKLIVDHVSVAENLFGVDDGDSFRQQHLYVKEIDAFLIQHQETLRALFSSYATESKWEPSGVSKCENHENQVLTIRIFQNMFEEHFRKPANLTDQTSLAQYFTISDLKLIFQKSKLIIIDELANPNGLKTSNEMTFDDFVESLVRIWQLMDWKLSFAEFISARTTLLADQSIEIRV